LLYLIIIYPIKSIAIDQQANKSFFMLSLVAGGGVFLLLLCCFCIKLRKGFSDDNDSVFESDAYHSSKPGLAPSSDMKKKASPAPPPPPLVNGFASSDSGYTAAKQIKGIKRTFRAKAADFSIY
jgi:hypothetical protein